MSTADFLFTPTVQRVLALALAQPERTFTLQELLDRAGGGHGGAQKQIDKLLNAGVLSEESKQGRQRRIRANTSFFLYPELRAIARKSFALAEPLRNALKPFESQIKEAFVVAQIDAGDKMRLIPHD